MSEESADSAAASVESPAPETISDDSQPVIPVEFSAESPSEILSEPVIAQETPPAPPAPVAASTAPWFLQMTYDMLRDLAARGRAAVQIRKRAKFEKILKYVEGHGKVTNHEVAQLLYVSDDTAWRYLEQLEKEGKLKQVGHTGHAVYYTRP